MKMPSSTIIHFCINSIIIAACRRRRRVIAHAAGRWNIFPPKPLLMARQQPESVFFKKINSYVCLSWTM
jgi:hypothetical protein